MHYPKTVIFCKSYADCAAIYRGLQNELGENFTEPPSAPHLQRFKLIDMYTRASTAEMKTKVIASFCASNALLRLIIATTAFGMGIDCPDIRVVVHWGAPAELESYVQESG